MWFYLVLNNFQQDLLLFYYQHSLILEQDFYHVEQRINTFIRQSSGFHAEMCSILPFF